MPLRYAKPFIVGVYYGCGKPDINEYFHDILHELLHLSPLSYSAGPCVAELRLVLGDCPMRAWMTGE
jgi:hypothetical protein